jgi:hypothetical protein
MFIIESMNKGRSIAESEAWVLGAGVFPSYNLTQ